MGGGFSREWPEPGSGLVALGRPVVGSGILPSAVDSLHPCSSPFGRLRYAQASKSSVLTICRANASALPKIAPGDFVATLVRPCTQSPSYRCQ